MKTMVVVGLLLSACGGEMTTPFACPDAGAAGPGTISIQAIEGPRNGAGSVVRTGVRMDCTRGVDVNGEDFFTCLEPVGDAGSRVSSVGLRFPSGYTSQPAGTVLVEDEDFSPSQFSVPFTSTQGTTSLGFASTETALTLTLGPMGSPRTATLSGRGCYETAAATLDAVPITLP